MARRPSQLTERQQGKGSGRRPGQSNQIRIIGGVHRGRKLRFPDLVGLRPTSDRVRETLFNWLQPVLAGAACLDLFAGSGALGLEAGSRGAGSVVMVERAEAAVRQLRENVALLGLEQVGVIQANALSWLERDARPFDIVFLDPPFADNLLEACCEKLEQNGWLADGARIYLERDAIKPMPQVPDNWHLLREKEAGQVSYCLYQR